MFNIKPTLACQFQHKGDETVIELWAAIKRKYQRTNHAQMIFVEIQLVNLQIHDTPNIMDQISEFVTFQKGSFLGKQANRS